MTVDISFGIHTTSTEDGYTFHRADWPDLPDEGFPDGTDSTYTIYPNQPRRLCPITSFWNWVEKKPTVKAVVVYIYAHSIGNDDQTVCVITPELLARIDKLSVQGEGLYQDRAKWLKFWAHKATDTFGSNAVIVIS